MTDLVLLPFVIVALVTHLAVAYKAWRFYETWNDPYSRETYPPESMIFPIVVIQWLIIGLLVIWVNGLKMELYKLDHVNTPTVEQVEDNDVVL